MLKGDIGDWAEERDWENFGGAFSFELSSETVCSIGGAIAQGMLMIFPAKLSWQGGKDMCNRLVITCLELTLYSCCLKHYY